VRFRPSMLEALAMSDAAIPPAHRAVSASSLIESLATSLSSIKHEDGLTDQELGRYLHKGTDAGKAYRTGYAEMGAVAFLRGCERWNGRFANDALSKVGMKLVPIGGSEVSGQTLQTRLSKLMLEVSLALEDGVLDDFEVQRMKRCLIEAGEAIDATRGRAA
jgi:hypothetical protein